MAPHEIPGDRYVWYVEVFISLDCWLNTLLRGWHHETLSSRAWRAWSKGLLFGKITRPIIDILFIWQSGKMDHCKRHYEAEVARSEAIVRVRK